MVEPDPIPISINKFPLQIQTAGRHISVPMFIN